MDKDSSNKGDATSSNAMSENVETEFDPDTYKLVVVSAYYLYAKDEIRKIVDSISNAAETDEDFTKELIKTVSGDSFKEDLAKRWITAPDKFKSFYMAMSLKDRCIPYKTAVDRMYEYFKVSGSDGQEFEEKPEEGEKVENESEEATNEVSGSDAQEIKMEREEVENENEEATNEVSGNYGQEIKEKPEGEIVENEEATNEVSGSDGQEIKMEEDENEEATNEVSGSDGQEIKMEGEEDENEEATNDDYLQMLFPLDTDTEQFQWMYELVQKSVPLNHPVCDILQEKERIFKQKLSHNSMPQANVEDNEVII